MGTKPDHFTETVLLLAKKLDSTQYALRGTSSLILQDVEMNVDDIDILCDKDTALKCNDLLKEHLQEKVTYKDSPKFKSYYGQFNINNINVEVMGEWQIKDTKGNWSEPFNANDKQRTAIQLENMTIYVTTIETELLVFARMGRWNAFHKIKRQVKSKDSDEENVKQTSFFEQ